MKDYQLYGIRHKETKEIWRTNSGKTMWQATNHAKNAFLTNNYPKVRKGYFGRVDCEYEVILLGSMKWHPEE